jgi:hypothetical protein
MRYLFWLATIGVLFMTVQAQAVELQPLATCTIKVFKEINRTSAWSGKRPEGCRADIYVEKRANGIFVTAWYRDTSEQGWTKVSLATAMGYLEVADKKYLEKGALDLTARTARIERCLNSIIQINDPLECRDSGTKTYSAGEETGIKYKRLVWLDDDGRHVVAEHAYGNTGTTVSQPADLFKELALPPGVNLDIHVIDIN